MYPSDEELAKVIDAIGNREAIAINQAWYGHPGRFIDEVPMPGAAPLNKLQLWAKPLANASASASGRRPSPGGNQPPPPQQQQPAAAVAVLVINYAAVGRNYTIDFSKLPLLGDGGSAAVAGRAGGRSAVAVSVRDVWERKPAGRGTGSYVV
eukprot:SAG22_NODE_7268_length_756_cov_1.182648_2_plen_151_part_01